ncbi:DEAD/DEAH box helicase [Prevotella melaninogenica]|uniref:DEAD/DEAH box helicase n=1 Tax=Prevotella melaninogenica TaxID=28132 RepID=UPI001C5FAD64|nr:AAA domain-containing protein [Prevotella melaninogenica]MBW4733483.1 DNA2/NAM7 family helicase [Prevotella melaninogenica]MBW4736023.1 DNA2/NAM7 family helicase [Prevotella melaninogenica]MBW4878584.1 DNA2/NAM7 family helicase [Prevotella melaninogenica]
MAHELFSRIADILSAPSEAQALIMHETLVIACHEGLKNTRHGFGNLSSQVESLCRQHNIAPQDIVAIQKMRRHSNSNAPILPEDVAYDCRALAIFVSAVVQEAIPSFLVGKIPTRGRTTENIQITNYRYIRCIVREWDDTTIQVAVTNQDSSEELLLVDYMNTPDYIDFSYLRPMLREGMQLNLLDCTVTRKKVVPRLIVVEPDYLIDISTIANCFETYGHHPLLFTVNRLTPRLSNKHIVLGNFAGSALDDIINHPAGYDIKDTFRSNFREKALDYATCPDFDAASFKQDAERQVENIKGIVDEIFQTFDREKAILEPSFVCERLGIQGRVDLMTTDLKLLVEQKSGKNTFIERKYKNPHGSLHVEKHYVQVLLYYGILQYNFQLSPKNAHIQLLYSKYPLPDGLLEVEPLQKLIREAIRFRNQAVATEFWMADNGFDRMLPLLTPQTLNLKKQNDNFYNRYLLPQLTETLAPLHQLNDLERAYFTRMMTFVIKEQLVSKVGVQEGVGNSNADLWNMPLAEKKETGNIYTGLTIIEKERSSSFNGYDTITLSVPQQGEDFLPNFRRGDMIYLYAYKKNEAPDVRMSILFKGSLQEIHGGRLVVHLNDGQQNPDLISGDYFAIEHAGSDIGGTSAIRSLYTFITSNEERRQLLLGQRVPRVDKSLTLSRSYHPDYDEIILKAKQAQDYFLLIGPPGTGKTSQALQFLVREQLAGNIYSQPSSAYSAEDSKHNKPSETINTQHSTPNTQTAILLLAYTNRAVDEICNMLTENELDYIRIGNEFSCDPKYSDHLLKEVLDENATLNSIKSTIADARIVVATTSTMNSNAALFNIKHFDLAIIDEASQILEPNIIGLLTSQHRGGRAIRKFILIGDHKQLPAVVQQDDTEVLVEDETVKAIHLNSCANSLFERLILTERAAGRTDFIGTLHKQGRMHPDIADFANRKFYAREQLECVPLAHQLEQTLAYNETSEDETDDVLKAHRMIFIPSKPCRQLNISEKVNTEEARIITDLLRRLYRQLGKNFDPQKSVGVIVPYRNQIAMIRKEIEKLGIPELEEISIDTVERYQGSQRDIILYSFTIQSRYQLDFLTANTFYEDGQPIDRKLNVAITRARKQLILTGNEPTLRQNQIFAELIDYIKEKGGYYAEKA